MKVQRGISPDDSWQVYFVLSTWLIFIQLFTCRPTCTELSDFIHV